MTESRSEPDKEDDVPAPATEEAGPVEPAAPPPDPDETMRPKVFHVADLPPPPPPPPAPPLAPIVEEPEQPKPLPRVLTQAPEAPPPSDRDSLVANILALIGSVGWLGFCGAYVMGGGGWERVLGYTPLELAALVAVGLLPLAVLWLFVAHFTRGSQVAVETELLRRRLDDLISGGLPAAPRAEPEPRPQPVDFTAAGDRAAALEASLRQAADTLAQAMERLDGRSSALLEALQRTGGGFEEVTAQAVRRADEIHIKLKGQGEALTATGAQAESHAQEMCQLVARQVDLLEAAVSRSLERAMDAADRLRGQAVGAEQTGERTAEKMAAAAAQLSETVARLGHQGVEIGTLLSEKSASIDRQLEHQRASFSESLEPLAQRSAALLEDLTTRVRDLDAALQRQSAGAAEAFEPLARRGEEIAQALEERVRAVGGLLEGQRAGVETAFEPLARRGGEIAQALEERVRGVGTVLAEQQSVLTGLATGLEDHAGRAQTVLREQATGFERVAAELLERVHGVETSLSARVADFSAATEQALERFQAVGDMAGRYGEEMRQASQLATAEALAVGQQLMSRRDEVSEGAAAALAQVQAVGAALADQARALDDAQGRMGEGARALTAVLGEQTDMYLQGGRKAAEDADVIRARLVAEIEQMGNATRLIFHHGEGLAEMAERIQAVIDGIGARIGQGTADLTAAAETVRGELGNADGLLAHLLDVVGRAKDGLAAAGRELRRSAGDIVAAADQAEASIGGVGQALGHQVTVIGEGCGSASDMLRALGQTLQAQAGEVDQVAQRALAQAEAAGELLARLGAEFEATSSRSAAQATAAGDTMRLGIRDLGTTADRVTMQLRTAGDTLRRQIEELGAIGGDAGERLDGLFDALREKAQEIARISDELIGQGEGVSAGVSRQIDELSHAVGAAEQLVLRLEKRGEAVSVESFLQEAAHIVERLQSLSVDIARVFPQGVDDRTWREFHSGDRSAFLRKVLRNLDRHQVAAIRARFEEDREFRDYVSQYLGEYEGLLTHVRNSERADVLTAVFSSAEVGKLYLVLARALGRLE